jgi:hypothetical protein
MMHVEHRRLRWLGGNDGQENSALPRLRMRGLIVEAPSVWPLGVYMPSQGERGTHAMLLNAFVLPIGWPNPTENY